LQPRLPVTEHHPSTVRNARPDRIGLQA
jgi:hypothetical protein